MSMEITTGFRGFPCNRFFVEYYENQEQHVELFDNLDDALLTVFLLVYEYQEGRIYGVSGMCFDTKEKRDETIKLLEHNTKEWELRELKRLKAEYE